MNLLTTKTKPLQIPLKQFVKWVSDGHAWIKDRESGQIMPFVPRLSQRWIIQSWLDQAGEGVPIRTMIPKKRRAGTSSVVQIKNYFLCKFFPHKKGTTYAHTDADTRNIFKIAKRVHEHTGNDDAHVGATSIQFHHDSVYECRTAGGRSGTSHGDDIDYMHISEVAYIENAMETEGDAIGEMIQAVIFQPHTMIDFESTGSGPIGDFFDRCNAAKAGESNAKLIFLPWYIDDNYRLEPPKKFKMTEDEMALARKYRLDRGQVYWFHCKRKDFTNMGSFRRSYPTKYEDCFAVGEGLVFPQYDSEKNRGEASFAGGVTYRSIDWGDTREHPFVCVWLKHWPDRRQGFLLSKKNGCDFMDVEFRSYNRKDKTGLPTKNTRADNDHSLDALRAMVMSRRLTGLVWVYRVWTDDGKLSPEERALEIHRLSGWECPEGVAETDLWRWYRGLNGEGVEITVADRGRPDAIRQFNKWGIPTIANRKPPKTRQGEKEDGIFMIQALLSGGSPFEAPTRNEGREAADRVVAAWERKRPGFVDLMDEEMGEMEEFRREEQAAVMAEPDEYAPDGFQ